MKADPFYNESPPFTEDDLDNCWPYYKANLCDILNGDYDLQTAREDLRGLIGSRFDERVIEKISKCEHDWELVDAGAKVCKKCNAESLYTD